MKQYSKLRVGIKEHLKDIKGAPLSVFIIMTLTCDRCGVFAQAINDIAKAIDYDRTTTWRAFNLLKKKRFVKKIGLAGKTPVWFIPKHDPKVEAMVGTKGTKYLVDNSTTLKNLGINDVA
jgi:hypothetical protein